jgi:protein-tyrosine phosphatase
MTVGVLLVCLGNICRSPMAEAVFQGLVDEAGLHDAILVDSAGTSDWHVGERAHHGTRRVLRAHGIEYEGRSRQITAADFSQFDYILAMDDSNLDDLRAMLPENSRAVVGRFLDYAPDLTIHEVPDPYYDGRFEDVYRLIVQGAQALLDHIREEKGL